MRFRVILITLMGLAGAFFAFLSQYKVLFFYILAFMFFIAVTFKVVKNIAARKNAQFG